MKTKNVQVWKSMSKRGGGLSLLQFLDFFSRGSADAPKTAVIGKETGVTVAGPLPLPDCRAAHLRAGFPGTAPHNAFHVLARIGRSHWIDRRTLLVIRRAINVLAPFRNISIEIEDAPPVWLLFSDRMCLFTGVVREPRELSQLVDLSKIVRTITAGATGILPFRFGREPIAARVIIAIEVRRLLVVTRLEFLQQ